MLQQLILPHKKKVVGLIPRAFLDFAFSTCDKKLKKKIVGSTKHNTNKTERLPC